jgi:hypothetical protein
MLHCSIGKRQQRASLLIQDRRFYDNQLSMGKVGGGVANNV